MLKINVDWLRLWSLPLSLLMNLGATAFATTIKLNLLPLNGVERGWGMRATLQKWDAPTYKGMREGNPRWTWGGTD